MKRSFSNSDNSTIIFRDGCLYGSDFRLDRVDYERDEYNGRCYILDTSRSFTSKVSREGGLVRRRISYDTYKKALKKACKQLGLPIPV